MLSYTTRTALEEATPILLLQCALHDDILRVCASAGVAWTTTTTTGVAWTNGRMRRVRTARRFGQQSWSRLAYESGYGYATCNTQRDGKC